MADVERPVLDDGDRHHLARVLRLRQGERVSVSDGAGTWLLCRFDGEGGVDRLGEPESWPSPHPAITVGFAPPKGDRADWAVQKLTELGVDRIIPLRTRRGVVRWEAQRSERQLARWRAICRQAAMQSRRLWLPVVDAPCPPAQVGGAPVGGAPVCSGGGPFPVGPVALAEPGGAPPSLSWPTVLIGPEGGWSEDELALGMPTIALGPGVLRTETAAVAAGAVLAALRAGLVSEHVAGTGPPLPSGVGVAATGAAVPPAAAVDRSGGA